MSAPILTLQLCMACEAVLGHFVGTRRVDRIEAVRFFALPETRVRASHGWCEKCAPDLDRECPCGVPAEDCFDCRPDGVSGMSREEMT